MQMVPGKLDCTRSRYCLFNRVTNILILSAIFLGAFCSGAVAQSSSLPPQYPEIARLGRSTYCNPYFGFRFTIPEGFKSEPVYLPVQPHGRHVLLAMHLQRLDRSAEVFISAFEDRSENSARLAARARIRQAHQGGLNTSGPSTVSVHEHNLYRLRIAAETNSLGDESSYYFVLRGYVVHVAIFTHERDLANALESAVERLEFVEPGDSACTAAAPVAPAFTHRPDPEPTLLYYGPALPTDLVESTLRNSPADSIPDGHFSHGTFVDSVLGVRVVLPPGWRTLPNREADQVTELMRDPTNDPGFTDRRRALFRACSRVVFTALDPGTELISQVHPALAVAAMPLGCVPDLVPPSTLEDRAASKDFATLLIRSLGVLLLNRGGIRGTSEGHLIFNLDGTLPYQIPGEKLSRRLGLRVSATVSGPWLIFVYSVTPTAAAQRDLESRITIETPSVDAAK
jgi:hypothetical protein